MSGDGYDSRLDHCVSSEKQEFPEQKGGRTFMRLKSKVSPRVSFKEMVTLSTQFTKLCIFKLLIAVSYGDREVKSVKNQGKM